MKSHTKTNGLLKEPEVLTVQEAYKEACRCLLCYDPPCSKACPAGTDPGKFIRQIRFLNFKGSARTVMRNNILGRVCALVCPIEKLCVKECIRTGIDIPIKIAYLQRFAVDFGARMGVLPVERKTQKKENIAIIGSGPAGLSAAYELSKIGYKVTIFESEKKAGGVLRYGIPSFRCPEKELDSDIEILNRFGVEFKFNSPVSGIDQAEKLLKKGYSAVFIAVGLQEPYTISISGIKLKDVTTAKDFLKSAKIEGHGGMADKLVRGKNVAVIGGGSVAMDVAVTCRALKGNRIYAISLESLKELPSCSEDIERARENHIIFKPQCQVTEILSDKNGNVIGVRGVETEWIKPDNFLPDNIRQIPDTSWTLKVQAVIQAIGLSPSVQNLDIYSSLKKKGKFISVNEETMETSVKAVFAGGDIVRGGSTVVQAVADGKRASAAIDNYIKGKL